jgi:hypothetical protein
MADCPFLNFYIGNNMLKKFGMFLLQGVVGLAFIVGGALFLVEYMAGCGETYTDSKGIVHNNECIFIR